MDSVNYLQDETNWTNLVLNKLSEILETHLLKINFNRLLIEDTEVTEGMKDYRTGFRTLCTLRQI